MRLIHSPSFRLWLSQILFLSLLLAFLFPGVFFRGEVIAPGDILFQCKPWKAYAPEGWERPQNRLMTDVMTAFLPYYAISIESAGHGELPLWNPRALAGMPLMANCQSAIFYPPRVLHYLFGLRWGTTFYILVKILLCGVTAFALARGMRLRPVAARFLSVGWMCGGYAVIWCNWSLTDVAVWFPLLFLGCWKLTRREEWGGYLLISISGALMLLAGHPETAFAFAVLLSLCFVFQVGLLIPRGRSIIRPVLLYTLAWVTALGIASVQVIPFLEYVANSSTFGERTALEGMNWLPPSAVLALICPRFFGLSGQSSFWGEDNSNLYYMLFTGASVMACVPFAFIKRRPEAGPLAICAVIGLLLAFRSPGLTWFHELPGLGAMREVYYAVFTPFAFLCLGAMGLDAWLRGKPPVRQWSILAGLVLAFCGLAVFLLDFNAGLLRALHLDGMVWRESSMTAGFLAGAVLLLLFRLKLAPARCVWTARALTILMICELVWGSRGLNPTCPPEMVYPETRLTTMLQRLPKPTRIGLGEGGVASGLCASYGIDEWLGYDGLYPARIINLQKTLGPDIWRTVEPACGVEYYLHDPEHPAILPMVEDPGRFELTGEADGLQIHRNTRCLGRAYVASEVVWARTDEEALASLKSGAIDVKRQTILTGSPDNAITAGEGPAGRVIHVEATLNTVTTRVHMDRAGILVLADAWYPGWRAYVDGKVTPIYPANYAFRGIAIPAGEHEARFAFRPGSLYLGAGVSGVSLLILMLACAWMRKMRKILKSPTP